MSDNLHAHPITTDVSRSYTVEGSYVDWAAILAGGVFALAISFLLLSFGASLGLSLTSPYRGEGVSASWLAIASGIWFAWVIITAFGAGGYLAGRMRRRAEDATADEVQVRDGTHGLIVWATGALVSTLLAAAGVGGLVSAGTSAVGSAVGTATEVVTEAAPSEYFANVMLRGSLSKPEAGQTSSGPAPTADNTDTAATSSGQPARSNTATARVSPAVQQEIANIITHSAASGEMAERDRSYLAQLVAANSDLDEEAARARIDAVNAEINEARAAAAAAVERTRVAGVIFGFIVAATLLIGAVAAFFAAAAGGSHRDEGLGFDIFTARR
jgi:hypothetical protein